jgi:hypothetical protein
MANLTIHLKKRYQQDYDNYPETIVWEDIESIVMDGSFIEDSTWFYFTLKDGKETELYYLDHLTTKTRSDVEWISVHGPA